jgi:hypothetical protein
LRKLASDELGKTGLTLKITRGGGFALLATKKFETRRLVAYESQIVSQKKFPNRWGKPAGLPRRPGRDVATCSEISFEKQSGTKNFFSIPGVYLRMACL